MLPARYNRVLVPFQCCQTGALILNPPRTFVEPFFLRQRTTERVIGLVGRPACYDQKRTHSLETGRRRVCNVYRYGRAGTTDWSWHLSRTPRSRSSHSCTLMTYSISQARRGHRDSSISIIPSFISASPDHAHPISSLHKSHDLAWSYTQSPNLVDYSTDQSTCMTGTRENQLNPSITIQTPEFPSFLYQQAQYHPTSFSSDWPMYQNSQNHFAGLNPGYQNQAHAIRSGHKRQASDSTIASNGPDSPYTQTTSFPYIVNSDRSPAPAYFLGDDSVATYSKPRGMEGYQSFPVGYMPSQLSHTPVAHSALKDMAIDHHGSAADDVPDFTSSRRSVSTHGRSSPSTPRNGNGEESGDRAFKVPANGESTHNPSFPFKNNC